MKLSPSLYLLPALALSTACDTSVVAAEEAWRAHCRERAGELRQSFDAMRARVDASLREERAQPVREFSARLATREEQLAELEAMLNKSTARETRVRGILRALEERRTSLTQACEDTLKR